MVVKKHKKKKEVSIFVSQNGPYLVSGNLPLEEEIMICDNDGSPINWRKGKQIKSGKNYALCRCGHSKNKPFCTGEHRKINFDGTETADFGSFSKNANKTVGKKIVLLDNGSFCNHSGFCTRGAGVWDSTIFASDKNSVKNTVKQICDCPTGRLVAVDKGTKKQLEPKFKKSVGLIIEPEGDGALWVKGRVEIKSSKKKNYEKRNRVCLCRCGKSNNKPFCDGSHLD
jgi:CDGSH-type Zn-finger protein